MKNVRMSISTTLFLSAIMAVCPSSYSKDFDLNDCVAKQTKYRVEGYLETPKDALRLLEDSPDKLSDRVWKAFREEVGKNDPTMLPMLKEWERAPHNALVKPIIDAQEAAVAQILAMRKAKHTIFLGTYIFGKDPYSYAILKEAKDALARGVDVRILVDSEGSFDLFHNELRALNDVPKGKVIDDFGKPTQRDATVTTVVFNPTGGVKKLIPNWFKHFGNTLEQGEDAKSLFRQLAHRMHTKILVTDADYPEGIAFIGGRNKDGKYYGYEKVGPHTYNDTEIMIRNDPAHFGEGKKTLTSTIGREYRKLEGHLLNEQLAGLMTGESPRKLKKAEKAYAKEIAKMDKAQEDMWKEGGEYDAILKRMEAEGFLEKGFDQSDTTFLTQIHNINREDVWTEVDHTGNRNPVSIVRELKQLAAKADKSITIVTPYPNLTKAERALLIRKMLDDPNFQFTMITNSLYSGDNIITQYVVDNILIPTLKKEAYDAAYQAAYKRLWRPGVLGQRFEEGVRDAADHEAQNFVDRFKIFALGKMDGVEFGGKEYYGKLHAKYAIFESHDPAKTVTVVGSYNGDNISRLHNAEIAVAVPGEGVTHEGFADKSAQLIGKSYVWGSDEWKKLRASKPLKKKRIIEKVVSKAERFADPIE